MGKKSAAQRKWENNKTILSPPEHQPPNADDEDPIKVLNNLKREQIINHYANKYGLCVSLLNQIWDFLAKQSPQKIKALKKGNIKNTLKRTEYNVLDVLKNGKVIRNDFKLHPENESKSTEEIEPEEIVVV